MSLLVRFVEVLETNLRVLGKRLVGLLKTSSSLSWQIVHLDPKENSIVGTKSDFVKRVSKSRKRKKQKKIGKKKRKKKKERGKKRL